ncbi:MAG: hypothetical protein Q7S08_04755 [bacterium]|nr:hypothetical protein [bacterium]
MRLTRDGRFERSDIWREGKWVDLWSVVHLLSGMSFGLALGVLGWGTTASIIIALLSFVLYETWEAMVKIAETPQNRFMDVVVGMASFLPTLFFSQGLSTNIFILVFGFTLTANIVMATLGWLASRKAEEFEHRMRRRLEERRRRIAERKAQRGMNV